MRFLYLLLHIILPYALRIYYPRHKHINKPKKYFNRTIYVSNHAASFMDPLVIGGLQRPIVFFMTRSDIFTAALQPVLWMAHMLPIYRQHDGVDTKKKNDATFRKCTKVLQSGRNLLIFGEGFTDDVFIRRLKPVKKGAVRIGFGTLEEINWSKKIYVSTIGVNYGDPNYIGADLLVSNGSKMCLNDYREEYLKHPAKTINELTAKIEKDLQNQLTHVENLKWVFFHEQATRLLRNGMHPEDTDYAIPLEQRWNNSKELAKWMNAQSLDESTELVALKADMEAYFKQLKSKKIKEKEISEIAENRVNKSGKILKLILLLPLSIIGLIHNFIPYKLIKGFVEKSFRRRVFWSSVKMMLGIVAIGIWNIPLIMLMHHYIFNPLLSDYCSKVWIVSLLYFAIVPVFGLIAYNSNRTLQNIKAHKRIQKMNLKPILTERQNLIERLRQNMK